MKEINVSCIESAVARLCIEANRILPDDIKERVTAAKNNESNALGKAVMCELCRNITVAEKTGLPVCQDTGMAVVFIEIGQDVHLVGGDLEDAINRGVAKGYTEGLLRKSVVIDPLNRINTNDNTPAVIHTKIVAGEKVKVTVAPKGFGSENMSAIKMLNPSDAYEGVVNFVLDTVKKAGGNPCPPIVVGVGIGGNFESSAYLAKKALCRSTDEPNDNEFYANMEKELLKKINELNIGPQGFGGNTTALAVNIEAAPTHIAGLPVAVNIGCHVTRHKTEVIG
ncbi:MAG: fumarate hydratase [Ruminococcaceae bacterium]|nr:fumarate hydratase [Oscillospiraceae bacterium]